MSFLATWSLCWVHIMYYTQYTIYLMLSGMQHYLPYTMYLLLYSTYYIRHTIYISCAIYHIIHYMHCYVLYTVCQIFYTILLSTILGSSWAHGWSLGSLLVTAALSSAAPGAGLEPDGPSRRAAGILGSLAASPTVDDRDPV